MARIPNSVDPDKTDHYMPSSLDLHCLPRYMVYRAERVKPHLKQTTASYLSYTVITLHNSNSYVMHVNIGSFMAFLESLPVGVIHNTYQSDIF